MVSQRREQANELARAAQPLIVEMQSNIAITIDSDSTRVECQKATIAARDACLQLTAQLKTCEQMLEDLNGHFPPAIDSPVAADAKQVRRQLVNLQKELKTALDIADNSLSASQSASAPDSPRVDARQDTVISINYAAIAAAQMRQNAAQAEQSASATASTSLSTLQRVATTSTTSSTSTATPRHENLASRIDILNKRLAKLDAKIEALSKENPDKKPLFGKQKYPKGVLENMSELAEERGAVSRELHALKAQIEHPTNLAAQNRYIADNQTKESSSYNLKLSNDNSPLLQARLQGYIVGLTGKSGLDVSKQTIATDISTQLKLDQASLDTCEVYAAHAKSPLPGNDTVAQFRGTLADRYSVQLVGGANSTLISFTEMHTANPQAVLLRMDPVSTYLARNGMDHRQLEERLPNDPRLTHSHHSIAKLHQNAGEQGLILEFTDLVSGKSLLQAKQDYKDELAQRYPNNPELQKAHMDAFDAHACSAVAGLMRDMAKEKCHLFDPKATQFLVVGMDGSRPIIVLSDKKSVVYEQTPDNVNTFPLDKLRASLFSTTHTDNKCTYLDNNVRKLHVQEVEKQALGATMVEILQGTANVNRDANKQFAVNWNSPELKNASPDCKKLAGELLACKDGISLNEAAEQLEKHAAKAQAKCDAAVAKHQAAAPVATSSTTSTTTARQAAARDDDDNNDFDSADDSNIKPSH